MTHLRRSKRIQQKKQQEKGEEDEDESNIIYAKPWNAKANTSKRSDSKDSNIKTQSFNVTAVSYKEAMDLIQENERKLKNACSDNKENEIDYKNIKIKYKGNEFEIDMESSNVHKFVLSKDEMKISGIFREYVCDYKFDDNSGYIEIPCPGIGLDEMLNILLKKAVEYNKN